MQLQRRIAYYQLGAAFRDCNKLEPENIAAGALTHIFLAFQLINEDFTITDDDPSIVARVSRLKKTYPRLNVNVAVGGWNFNDPPTQTRFSDMVSSSENRQKFIHSVTDYLRKYGLNGIDIDWEYPVATDRGGVPKDYSAFVDLIREMREYWDTISPGWEITITLPSSYWYLRGFDLEGLQRHVSWFNVMTYDLHGMWDQHNLHTGPYLLGHTNTSEIDVGLDLLWRNSVKPENVVMGFGFYGRSFTMADIDCHQPNGICEFSTSGVPGTCSGEAGILFYSEIESSNGSINAETYYDARSTVKYNVFDGTQWVSYDDEQSFNDKKRFLSSRCLSGLMIWSIDQDDQQRNALTGLLGEDAMRGALLQGGDLDDEEKEELASEFAAYTGQKCFVTTRSTDGSPEQQKSGQTCPIGSRSVGTAHAPIQGTYQDIEGNCAKGWYRHVCCLLPGIPQNCMWTGGPGSSKLGCSGVCGDDQFKLNTDTFTDAKGTDLCRQGERALCCDSTPLISECKWTDCQGPSFEDPSCPKGFKYLTSRSDRDDGSFCDDGDANPQSNPQYKRAFCCPEEDTPKNCSWANPGVETENGVAVIGNQCQPAWCDITQVQFTTAYDPKIADLQHNPGTFAIQECIGYPVSSRQTQQYKYCCDPPSEYDDRWPVDPKYLWENPHDDEGDDVQWAYVDNHGNNDADQEHNGNDPDDYGQDPYGFVMLNGPPGSINNEFVSDFTVVRESSEIHNTKRSLLTTNRTYLDQVFDHTEETIFVYCNHERDHPRCDHLLLQGAEGTIIKLPAHVGEGPFARVKSMDRAVDYQLPQHHKRDRALRRNAQPVFKITLDYAFHLSKRADEVNMRVDYTNLLTYWDTVTHEPAKIKKRGVLADGLTSREWRSIVQKAKESHHRLTEERFSARRKRHAPGEAGRAGQVFRRWFGSFVDWLTRLTTVQKGERGVLPLSWRDHMLLYHAKKGCQASTAFAELSMFLDSDIDLDATYAYYFSGSLTGITDTFAYFGIRPTAYLGLQVNGLARLQYQSERKKLIDTLSWPGLAIKGLAAVGPTLDVWGQLQSVIQLSGQMQVGVRFNFEKSEWYWPEDASADDYSDLLGLSDDPELSDARLQPSFSANVQASADLNVLVTPEANLGIQVGTAGLMLVNAQLLAYVNTTLNFHAEVAGNIDDTSSGYSYDYGVWLYYNLGIGATASLVGYDWGATRHDLFNPPKNVKLCCDFNVSSSDELTSRNVPIIRAPRRGLLNSMPEHSAEIEVIESFTEDQTQLDRRTPDPMGPGTTNTSLDVKKLFYRQSDSNDNTPSQSNPEFSLSQLFDCPKGQNCPGFGDSSTPTRRGNITRRASTAPCSSTLPDFRINCGVFSNVQVGTETITGICDGEQAFLQRLALPNTGFVMTFDSDAGRSKARRTHICGHGSACNAANNLLSLATGYNSLTSCDEFPFASTEEGGAYFGNRPNNPVHPGMTCAPVWQQNIQGFCNKVFRNLETNVKYADSVGSGQIQYDWKGWGDDVWTGGSPGPNIPWPRFAEYPNWVGQAGGISTNDWKNGKVSYMHKRNFTFGMAFPTGPTDGAAWGSQPLQSYKSDTQSVSGTDATQVLCAVNIHGQSDIYRYGGYNGACVTNSPKNIYGYGNTPGWAQCKITFTGSPGPTKREIGTFGDWQIEKIEMEADAEPAGLLPDGIDLNEFGKAMPYVKSSLDDGN